MRADEILLDCFGRVPAEVHAVLDGLTPAQLGVRLEGRANPIGWLVWHLARVEDDHIAGVAGSEQVWTAQGYADSFGLQLDVGDIGYGHTDDEVDLVQVPSAALLREYYDAVHARTIAYVSGLAADDLDRVVDTNWDPPVTLGVRLVSVLGDIHQHVGQAAFVRGILMESQAP